MPRSVVISPPTALRRGQVDAIVGQVVGGACRGESHRRPQDDGLAVHSFDSAHLNHMINYVVEMFPEK
jgi:hypothetical protein